ncbi:MAG: PAS-domain containing protein, partial [Acetobacteraceae bacterium]|nr:PAS-domain containing protein [Acetobacteraceae bacterium]
LAMYDAERRLVLSNPAYEDLIGLPRSTARPGMTQREVLEHLVRRGEIANAEPDEITAEGRRLDRSTHCTWQRERPNGRVVRLESQPMPGGGYLVEVTDITTARRAEDEARRRAALLDGVLASLPHGVVVYGPDQRVAMVNAAHQSIMAGSEVAVGEHREEIARRRAYAGEYGPGDPEALMRENLPSLAGGQPVRLQRVRPNGMVIDVHYTALPDGGRVQVTTDITALHRARTEATERAAMLQVMLDNTRHGIALYGPDRRLRLANALAAGLSFLRPEEMVPGRSLDEMVLLQLERGFFGEGEAARAMAEQAIRADRSRPERKQRTMPDGRVLEIFSDPTPDGGFVITWSDVTELVEAKAEASQRAAMLQVMLDNTRHGISYFGPDRRMIATNALSAEMVGDQTGLNRIGMTLEELLQRQYDCGNLGSGETARQALEAALTLDRSKP